MFTLIRTKTLRKLREYERFFHVALGAADEKDREATELEGELDEVRAQRQALSDECGRLKKALEVSNEYALEREEEITLLEKDIDHLIQFAVPGDADDGFDDGEF